MTTELFMQWVDESSRLLTESRNILLNRYRNPSDIEGARAMIELARELRMVAKDIEAAKQSRIAADAAMATHDTPSKRSKKSDAQADKNSKPKSPTSSKGTIRGIPVEELFGKKML